MLKAWRAVAIGRYLIFLSLVAGVQLSISTQSFAQTSASSEADGQTDEAFQQWLQVLISEARELGIAEAIIDQALVSVTPIPQVVSNDRNQAEFVETLDEYLEKRVTDWRIQTGRERMARHRDVLAQDLDVVRALVTLAYDPRRADSFRRELLAALQILQEGHIEHANMKGSWAGAMGQSQFMPSSFVNYAVDFDGDGRRNIWTSEADVFASIANYLSQRGWQSGQRWGREISLPDDYHERAQQWSQGDASFSCSVLRRHTVQRSLAEWQMAGVRTAAGADLPQADFPGSIVLPDGEDGSAFMTYPNFRVILTYNCANNYALAVAKLADSY